MCGIVGLLSLSQSTQITESLLITMRDTMVHRGPDGGGVWLSTDGSIGLGHRRLSIIDLSTAASQPMSNEDGTVWVTFNGEIYNHVEIRRELQEIGGHVWVTDHSDTEVIVHAYEQWGIDCLHKFRGMFAIGIWDSRSRELWLARDRLGIKPLYYSFYSGKLAFASEIKALLADPERSRAVNENALFHYLSFLTTPAPMTLFEGINKLESGCYLRIRENGEVKEHRYWEVWDNNEDLKEKTEDEITQRLLEELRTSVKLRKVSDVPVGVFLSGGIDSSTNAKLFSEGEVGTVKTFSIGYEGNHRTYLNELQYARKVADEVGAEYHQKLLSVNDLIEFLPRMVQLQDEPIADPVCVPVYYVSKLARDNGVIVCQVGEGADELFLGYPAWKTSLILQSLSDLPFPKILRRAGLHILRIFKKNHSFPFEWLRRSAQGVPIFWGGAEAFTHEEKMNLLSPRLKTKFKDATSWDAICPIHERFKRTTAEKTTLNWMTFLDLNLRLPELLLMRVDKMSMGVSLEARVPFLDYKFVEFAMSIPTNMKMRGKELKRILKKAVKGLIPDEIINRPKQGFGVPLQDWIFDKLGKEIEKELLNFAKDTDFLSYQAVQELLDDNRPKIREKTWYLYNFALWWRIYIKNE